jgi:hypothetical protein
MTQSLASYPGIFVLYHRGCADGFAAALAAWLEIGPVGQYIPVAYGEPMPEIPDKSQVYILDFSYDRAQLVELARRSLTLVVLDHHKSAAAAVRPIEGCDHALLRFNNEKSGAVLAWEHFHPFNSIPNLFLYVQDRDLWRWDLRFSREISAALATYPYDFATWEQIMLKLDDDIAFVELLLEGRVALRAMDRLVEIQAKQAVAGRIGGYDVPVCNCTAHVDEVCHKLLELNPASPFVAAYRDQAGKTRRWSLRSRVGFDCSEISKQYGGGGHAQASGFEEALSTIMTKCPHEGLMAIATERDHQYVKHGYKEDHDDVHRDGSLAKAAKCYLDTAVVQIAAEQETIPPCYSHKDWPWEPVEFHPETSVENLTKAGALIAAELDRLHRAAFPVNA